MMEVLVVYDSAASRYLEPFTCPTVEYALREFRTAVNKEGHTFWKYPGDFTLFAVGKFDPETGQITPEANRSLGVGIQFVQGDAS